MDDKKKKPVKVHHFPFNGLYEIEKRCPNCMMKFKKRWGKCPKCKQEIDWAKWSLKEAIEWNR